MGVLAHSHRDGCGWGPHHDRRLLDILPAKSEATIQLADQNAVVVGDGWPCLVHFHFEHESADELRTLYTQQMLQRSFLAGGGLYATLAHTDDVIARYGEAIDEVFAELRKALESGTVKERLNGPVAHSGFRRLM